MEEKKEVGKGTEGKEDVANEGEETIATIVLRYRDVNAIHGENVDEVEVVGDDDGSMTAINYGELEGTAILVGGHRLIFPLFFNSQKSQSGGQLGAGE